MKKKLLLTGISGFIGYNIAKFFLENTDYDLFAIVRENTNYAKCSEFLNSDRVTFFTDFQLYESQHFDALIHCAWSGVSVENRNIWEVQFQNILFTNQLLQFAKATGVKKIVCLGSQAEYGSFEGRINENAATRPTTAYGVAKVVTSSLVSNFCQLNQIEWYWLRLFSIFGEKEDAKWFITYTINEMLEKRDLNLTLCEQKYDYLHTDDLSKGILTIIDNTEDHSGVYNLSSNTSLPLKSIVLQIKEILQSDAAINFGAVPYRVGQIMHMEGDSNLFFNTYKFKPKSFSENILNTIKKINNGK